MADLVQTSKRPAQPSSSDCVQCQAVDGGLAGIRSLVRRRQQQRRAGAQQVPLPGRLRILRKCDEAAAEFEAELVHKVSCCSKSVSLPRRLRIRRRCYEPGAELELAQVDLKCDREGMQQESSSIVRVECGPSVHLPAAASQSGRRAEQEERGDCEDRGAHDLRLPRLLGSNSSLGGDKGEVIGLSKTWSSPMISTSVTNLRKPVNVVLAPLEAARGFDCKARPCNKRLQRAASVCAVFSF